jgi:hypothetical protein
MCLERHHLCLGIAPELPTELRVGLSRSCARLVKPPEPGARTRVVSSQPMLNGGVVGCRRPRVDPKMAWRATVRLSKGAVSSSSRFRELKKLSRTGLSQQFALQLMLPCVPMRVNSA